MRKKRRSEPGEGSIPITCVMMRELESIPDSIGSSRGRAVQMMQRKRQSASQEREEEKSQLTQATSSHHQQLDQLSRALDGFGVSQGIIISSDDNAPREPSSLVQQQMPFVPNPPAFHTPVARGVSLFERQQERILMAPSQETISEEPKSGSRGRKRTYAQMQRDHSRSDSKGQRLQWEVIDEGGIQEPPRKRRKNNSDEEAQQEMVVLNQSQTSTPPGRVEGASNQERSSLDDDDF